MAVVTKDDLIAYMSGISLSVIQTASAVAVIAGVQKELELHLNRSLEPVHVRQKVQTNERGEARLKYSPIQRILSYKPINATLVVPTVVVPDALQAGLGIDGLQIIDLVPSQYNIVPGGIFLGNIWSWYIVEYIGGGLIANELDAVKTSILRVASRDVMNNHDQSISLKGDTMSDPTETIPQLPLGWQPEELAKLEKLRRRVMV